MGGPVPPSLRPDPAGLPIGGLKVEGRGLRSEKDLHSGPQVHLEHHRLCRESTPRDDRRALRGDPVQQTEAGQRAAPDSVPGLNPPIHPLERIPAQSAGPGHRLQLEADDRQKGGLRPGAGSGVHQCLRADQDRVQAEQAESVVRL